MCDYLTRVHGLRDVSAYPDVNNVGDIDRAADDVPT
jgi:hypothetical protein